MGSKASGLSGIHSCPLWPSAVREAGQGLNGNYFGFNKSYLIWSLIRDAISKGVIITYVFKVVKYLKPCQLFPAEQGHQTHHPDASTGSPVVGLCTGSVSGVPDEERGSQVKGNQQLQPASLPKAFSRLPAKGNFYLFIFLCPRGLWDLSSPTRDQTCTPCSGSTES